MVNIKEWDLRNMSDFREGWEVGDDKEMSEVGSPPSPSRTLLEARIQNGRAREEYARREEAELRDLEKTAENLGIFGYKLEFFYDESECKEIGAIRRYETQHKAAEKFLDALADVLRVLGPWLRTASTHTFVTRLEFLLPGLRTRWETLVEHPRKFFYNKAIELFHVPAWRATDARERMGSLMWHLECTNCVMVQLMQLLPEIVWMKTPLYQLGREDRELKQVMISYDASVKALYKSREIERKEAQILGYVRTREVLMPEMVTTLHALEPMLNRLACDTSEDIEIEIFNLSFRTTILLGDMPDVSSFYKTTGDVGALDMEKFATNFVTINACIAVWNDQLRDLHRDIRAWRANTLQHNLLLETEDALIQTYMDKVAALHSWDLPERDNWRWSAADFGFDLKNKKRILLEAQPKANNVVVTK